MPDGQTHPLVYDTISLGLGAASVPIPETTHLSASATECSAGTFWTFPFFLRFFTMTPSSLNPSRRMTSGPRMSMIATELLAKDTAMNPEEVSRSLKQTDMLTYIRDRTRDCFPPLQCKYRNRLETIMLPFSQMTNLCNLLDPLLLICRRHFGRMVREIRIDRRIIQFFHIVRASFRFPKLGHNDFSSHHGNDTLESFTSEVNRFDADCRFIGLP
jgi:hypothetical protein